MAMAFVCLCHCDLQDGSTALICSALCGHADCVRLLLDSGASKEAKTSVRRLSLALLLRQFIFALASLSFLYLYLPDMLFSIRDCLALYFIFCLFLTFCLFRNYSSLCLNVCAIVVVQSTFRADRRRCCVLLRRAARNVCDC